MNLLPDDGAARQICYHIKRANPSDDLRPIHMKPLLPGLLWLFVIIRMILIPSDSATSVCCVIQQNRRSCCRLKSPSDLGLGEVTAVSRQTTD